MWQHWINFILGILVAVFAYSGNATGTTMAVIGFLVILFSLWGGIAGSAGSHRTGKIQTT